MHYLTAKQIRDTASCPKCGAAAGKPCDPNLLEGRSDNHGERAKLARKKQPTKISQRRN